MVFALGRGISITQVPPSSLYFSGSKELSGYNVSPYRPSSSYCWHFPNTWRIRVLWTHLWNYELSQINDRKGKNWAGKWQISLTSVKFMEFSEENVGWGLSHLSSLGLLNVGKSLSHVSVKSGKSDLPCILRRDVRITTFWVFQNINFSSGGQKKDSVITHFCTSHLGLVCVLASHRVSAEGSSGKGFPVKGVAQRGTPVSLVIHKRDGSRGQVPYSHDWQQSASTRVSAEGLTHGSSHGYSNMKETHYCLIFCSSYCDFSVLFLLPLHFLCLHQSFYLLMVLMPQDIGFFKTLASSWSPLSLVTFQLLLVLLLCSFCIFQFKFMNDRRFSGAI